ncbi:MAG: LacI family DNA-binding transcriptional regulator [Chloroflexota bacterium]|nr:LacI family DNA-binding transcriptional regulator [Chloroflexota bacterium]
MPPRVKLDGDKNRLIAYLAGQDCTLREIAAEAGVSHETVRRVIRDADAAAV